MKTKEELSALKEEIKSVGEKLAELSEDELKEVTGGTLPSEIPFPTKEPSLYKEYGIEWTAEPEKWEDKITPTNAGSYNIYYRLISEEK